MIVRGLDADGDWLFGKGPNDYKSNKDQLAQTLSTRLKSFLGDCFFALNAGLDWWNYLSSKDPNMVSLGITSITLNTLGVTKITSLNWNLDDARNFNIIIKIDSIYGQITIQQTVQQITVFNPITTEDGNVITTEDGNPISAEN